MKRLAAFALVLTGCGPAVVAQDRTTVTVIPPTTTTRAPLTHEEIFAEVWAEHRAGMCDAVYDGVELGFTVNEMADMIGDSMDGASDEPFPGYGDMLGDAIARDC